MVGQEHAKKSHVCSSLTIITREIASDVQDGVEIEKSNMLIDRTDRKRQDYLVKTLARLLDDAARHHGCNFPDRSRLYR